MEGPTPNHAQADVSSPGWDVSGYHYCWLMSGGGEVRVGWGGGGDCWGELDGVAGGGGELEEERGVEGLEGEVSIVSGRLSSLHNASALLTLVEFVHQG